MKYNNIIKLTEKFYKEAIKNLSIMKLGAGGYYMPDDEEEEEDLGALTPENMIERLSDMFDKTSNEILASYLEAVEDSYNKFNKTISESSGFDEDVATQTEKIINLLNNFDSICKRILSFAPLTTNLSDWDEIYSPEDVINLIQFIYKQAENQLQLWSGQEEASIRGLSGSLAAAEIGEATEEVIEDKEIQRRIDELGKRSKYKQEALEKRKIARRDPSHPLHESMQREKEKAKEKWQKIKKDKEKWESIKNRMRNYNKRYYAFDDRIKELKDRLSDNIDIEEREEILKKIEKIETSRRKASSKSERQVERHRQMKKLVTIVDPVTGAERKITDWANLELDGFIKTFSERMANERKQIIKVLTKKSDIAKKCELEIKRLSEAESRGKGSIAEEAANLRRAVRSHLRDPGGNIDNLFTGFALSIRYGKSFRKLLMALRSIKDLPKKLEETDKKTKKEITQEEIDKVHQILITTKDLIKKFSILEIKGREGSLINTYFATNQIPVLVQLVPMLTGLHAALSASAGSGGNISSQRILEQDIPKLRVQDPESSEAEAEAEAEAAQTEIMRRRSALRLRKLYSYADAEEVSMTPKVREIFESIVEDESNAMFAEIERMMAED